MNRVVITLGSMLAGTLASLLGPRWALASMGALGAFAAIMLYLSSPRARLIR